MDKNKRKWLPIFIIILGIFGIVFHRPVARFIAKEISEPVFWKGIEIKISSHNYVVNYKQNELIDLISFYGDKKTSPLEDMLFVGKMNENKAELIFSRIDNLCINNDCEVKRGCKYDPNKIDVNCVQIIGKLRERRDHKYHVYYRLDNSDIFISYHGREENHHIFDHELDQIFSIEKSWENLSNQSEEQD